MRLVEGKFGDAPIDLTQLRPVRLVAQPHHDEIVELDGGSSRHMASQRSLASRQLGAGGIDGLDELAAVGRWRELDRPARRSQPLPGLVKDRSGVGTGPIRADPGQLVFELGPR
jgi:hypothetical protein